MLQTSLAALVAVTAAALPASGGLERKTCGAKDGVPIVYSVAGSGEGRHAAPGRPRHRGQTARVAQQSNNGRRNARGVGMTQSSAKAFSSSSAFAGSSLRMDVSLLRRA